MPRAKTKDGAAILEPAAAGVMGPRHLLKDRAYIELKDRILRGDFEPGSFLSERQIAGWLAMSKTPIRAALEKLESEGFVTTSPQQGILVRELSIHEIADQFEIRVALETFVARSIAGRLTADQGQQLEDNLTAQQASLHEGTIPDTVQLDADFHILFCRFLGNQEILKVMEQLRERIHRVILRVDTQRPDRLPTSYAEHRAIADAILRGDGALAARTLEKHLDFGKQYLLSPRGR